MTFPRRLFPRPRRLRALSGLLVPLLALGPAWAAHSRRPTPAPSRRAAVEMNVTAIAAVLMDAGTGQVLYDRNAHLLWPPASTTKIMTALVALDQMPLDARITITPEVARFREGAVVGLPAGARIPLRDLLYALLLASGNDAALAIAEGVAGTVPAFVDRMNAKAVQLGAFQTHFTSPHGLYDREHYSTAYDLALIARVALENPTFRQIVHTRVWTLALPGRAPRRLINHNHLLARYPGADGVKTGYVHQSGQTLVASATHHGWRLIAVLLDSRRIYTDASRLLDYGFAHSRATPLVASDLRRDPPPSEVAAWVTRLVVRFPPAPLL